MDCNTIHTNGKAAVLAATTKPPSPRVDPSQIHDGLTMFDRFTGWRWKWNKEKRKWDKPPIDARTGQLGSSTDPAKWCSFREAISAHQQGQVDGIGFVLGEADGGVHFAGIDLDDCRDIHTGELSDLARDIIDTMNTYCEVSPSGTGVKLFFIGTLPAGHATKNKAGAVEVYTGGRYFTLTGQRIEGTPKRVENRQAELEAVWQKYIGSEQVRPAAAETNGKPSSSAALKAMLRIKPAANESDGSKRLLAVSCRTVEYDLPPDIALATIRKYERRYPFSVAWTDDDIFRRLRDAEQKTERGSATGDDDDKKKKQSTADKLVELALEKYRIGRTETDEAFAVEIDGPNIAILFRGSRDALRSSLARAHREQNGRTPNATALADAMTALQGEAYAAEPEPVYLRAAEHDGKIVLDLGDASGRVVIVSPAGWNVVDRSPVLFKRTAATGVLPEPQRGGSLNELRALLNVSAETWPLALGWEVAALVPNIPHPILLLGGQQGTGKTSAARKLVGLVDPSPAALRSSPRDVETWCITAAGSYVVGIDNVSDLPEWLQDSLCKSVTGDGWLRRKLYTDGELAVLSFRRVILLTSIDPGALRGDLGDRVLLVDLEAIDETKRRAERDIEGQYDEARPRILGALLDLLVKVLAELPNVHLDRLPRMADFGRLLAAMDNVLAGDQCDRRSLDIYLDQRGRIAETVIESDQVALAIQALLDVAGEWEGTAGELLEKIAPEKPPKDWPKTPQSLGGMLKRLMPALEQAGIVIEHPPRTGRRKVLSLRTRKESQQVVTPVTSSQTVEIQRIDDDDQVTSGDQRDRSPVSLVTPENSLFPDENGSCDQCDQNDEQLQSLSSWGEV